MTPVPEILAIHTAFTRHERRYCLFSVTGRDEEFLYYSHTSRPLRSLMFGKKFLGQLPNLMKKEDLCIECGLGLSVAGGVALDAGDLIAWHCTVEEANAILAGLKRKLHDEGQWIEPF
ncbi:MAG: hypothetical protein LUQ66_12305 [Methanoregula sp.]|nr:hypothetical protein [Methanoregula sp.]